MIAIRALVSCRFLLQGTVLILQQVIDTETTVQAPLHDVASANSPRGGSFTSSRRVVLPVQQRSRFINCSGPRWIFLPRRRQHCLVAHLRAGNSARSSFEPQGRTRHSPVRGSRRSVGKVLRTAGSLPAFTRSSSALMRRATRLIHHPAQSDTGADRAERNPD